MGLRQDLIQWATSARVKPPLTAQNLDLKLRSTPDGALVVSNLMATKHGLTDEGSYFVTTNPTPGTAIAYGSAGTQASFSDTVPFAQVINTASPNDPNAPVVFLDYLKILQNGTAPATTTAARFAIKIDTGYRASTAGTPATNTPVSPNMQLGMSKPVAQVITYSGAVATIPASSSASRLVAVGCFKGAAVVNLDEYQIAFGMADAPATAVYSATVSSYCTRAPAIAIGPGQSATIHVWFPGGATNPFSYEFELGHFER